MGSCKNFLVVDLEDGLCDAGRGARVSAGPALASGEERALALCCRAGGHVQQAGGEGARGPRGRGPHLRERPALPAAGRGCCGAQRGEQPEEGPL